MTTRMRDLSPIRARPGSPRRAVTSPQVDFARASSYGQVSVPNAVPLAATKARIRRKFDSDSSQDLGPGLDGHMNLNSARASTSVYSVQGVPRAGQVDYRNSPRFEPADTLRGTPPAVLSRPVMESHGPLRRQSPTGTSVPRRMGGSQPPAVVPDFNSAQVEFVAAKAAHQGVARDGHSPHVYNASGFHSAQVELVAAKAAHPGVARDGHSPHVSNASDCNSAQVELVAAKAARMGEARVGHPLHVSNASGVHSAPLEFGAVQAARKGEARVRQPHHVSNASDSPSTPVMAPPVASVYHPPSVYPSQVGSAPRPATLSPADYAASGAASSAFVSGRVALGPSSVTHFSRPHYTPVGSSSPAASMTPPSPGRFSRHTPATVSPDEFASSSGDLDGRSLRAAGAGGGDFDDDDADRLAGRVGDLSFRDAGDVGGAAPHGGRRLPTPVDARHVSPDHVDAGGAWVDDAAGTLDVMVEPRSGAADDVGGADPLHDSTPGLGTASATTRDPYAPAVISKFVSTLSFGVTLTNDKHWKTWSVLVLQALGSHRLEAFVRVDPVLEVAGVRQSSFIEQWSHQLTRAMLQSIALPILERLNLVVDGASITPYALWHKLTDHFEGTKYERITVLNQELSTITIRSFPSASEFLNRLQAVRSSLASFQEIVTDLTMIQVLQRALEGHSLHNVLLQHIASQQIRSFDSACTYLRTYSNLSKSSGSAFGAFKGVKKRLCANCHSTDHRTKSCPLPYQPRRCFRCKAEGHTIGKCPAKSPSHSAAAQAAAATAAANAVVPTTSTGTALAAPAASPTAAVGVHPCDCCSGTDHVTKDCAYVALGRAAHAQGSSSPSQSGSAASPGTTRVVSLSQLQELFGPNVQFNGVAMVSPVIRPTASFQGLPAATLEEQYDALVAARALSPPDCTKWLLDSGCSTPLSNDPDDFPDLQPLAGAVEIAGFSGSVVQCTHGGTIRIKAPGGKIISVANAIFAPEATHKLLSVSALHDSYPGSWFVTNERSGCFLDSSYQKLFEAPRVGKLYVLFC